MDAVIKTRRGPKMDENKYKFQMLTPLRDVDLNIYEDAIDFIFNNDDVKNVAISGAYGAGKSSVLESYKLKKSNKCFLHISLAHFRVPNENGEVQQEVEKTDTNAKNIQSVEMLLEGKIINQLMHQIPAENIPQTNFKIKKKAEIKNMIVNTLFLVLFIIAILHISMFESWSNYVDSLTFEWLKLRLDFTTHTSSLLFSSLVCITLLIVFIYFMVKMQNNKNVFRKISLQGNEIEIFENQDESYFDKYLNEVLYLFENSDADVIVFEDMDRFNASLIFERLREVNNLVNLRLKKDGKHPLRFFYLIRDDIFISKDRTKFFDYIVPVVPVVDSSNSYDQFISYFKESGVFERFNEGFLKGLSLYIDDMRLLKNIYNEFVVYYNRLNTIELDCDRMLAIITYKNLFPSDFSNLQLNKGMVFTIFNKKDEFIREEIEKLKEQVTEKKRVIEMAKKEHLNSIEELNAVYRDKRSSYNYTNNYNQQKQLDVQYNLELSERTKAIESVLNNRLPDLEAELIHIENEIVLTRSKQLKDIITRENINAIFKVTSVNEIGVETKFSEIKGSEYFDLLKYLIRNGYIYETYSDYMTLFHENSLSIIDKNFLRSITDKRGKEYTYQLKERKKVVDSLQEVAFDQEETLNFDLLEYLLQTPDKVPFLNRLIIQLEKTKNFKFISGYFDAAKETPNFIINLNLKWPEIFSYMVRERDLSDKQIRLFSIHTLYYSNADSILAVNVDSCLTEYISKNDDFLAINAPNIEKLIDGFILLGVSFISIDYGSADKELFNAVYKNSLYELNFDNLALILSNIYSIENKADIQHKNFTLVMSQSNSPLELYVNENLGKYMDIILANCNGVVEDTEEIALFILNSEDDKVSYEQKNEYISFLRTPITSINDIEDNTLWDSLFDNRVAFYSEDNIMVYFNERKELDSIVINFINNGDKKIDFSSYRIVKEEEAKELFDVTISCNELSNNRYTEILCSLGFYCDSFDVVGISEEKFQVLVEQEIVRMNLISLKFVRENYSSQILLYIAKYLNDYADAMTAEYYIFDEMMNILSWDVDDEIKIQLLKFTNEPVSILHKKYTSAVNEYILKNNLDSSDHTNLFASYESWEPSIQGELYVLAVKYIAQIIEYMPLNPNDRLLQKIFELSDVVENDKVDLFISLFPKMNEDTCKEYLNILGFTEFIKIFGRGRPKLEVNSTNERILTAFKDNKRIYDFHRDEVDTEYYKIIKRAPVAKPD
jgi:hypothetical protein